MNIERTSLEYIQQEICSTYSLKERERGKNVAQPFSLTGIFNFKCGAVNGDFEKKTESQF